MFNEEIEGKIQLTGIAILIFLIAWRLIYHIRIDKKIKKNEMDNL